jgi:hypothetical protein
MPGELHCRHAFHTLVDDMDWWWVYGKRRLIGTVRLDLTWGLETLSNAEDAVNDDGVDTFPLLQLSHDQYMYSKRTYS